MSDHLGKVNAAVTEAPLRIQGEKSLGKLLPQARIIVRGKRWP